MKNLYLLKKIQVINPRYISYSYFGLSVTVCSIFIFFFVRPTLTEASRLLQTIKKGEEVNQQLSVKLENLAKAEIIINENKNLIPIIDEALPDIVNSPNLIDKLSQIALESNVNIANINVNREKTGTKNINADQVTATIAVSGSYEDLSKFINKIENNVQIFTTHNISINQNSENYTATINLNAYGYMFNPDTIETQIVPFKGEQK